MGKCETFLVVEKYGLFPFSFVLDFSSIIHRLIRSTPFFSYGYRGFQRWRCVAVSVSRIGWILPDRCNAWRFSVSRAFRSLSWYAQLGNSLVLGWRGLELIEYFSHSWSCFADKYPSPMLMAGQCVDLVSYSGGTVRSTPGYDILKLLPSFVCLETRIEKGSKVRLRWDCSGTFTECDMTKSYIFPCMLHQR